LQKFLFGVHEKNVGAGRDEAAPLTGRPLNKRESKGPRLFGGFPFSLSLLVRNYSLRSVSHKTERSTPR